ncbi:MAG: hypothetical protein JO265_06975 [Acidimicrobiia bacterium]|nr:hypothetical protein [Acidimicrobiia bacterium]
MAKARKQRGARTTPRPGSRGPRGAQPRRGRRVPERPVQPGKRPSRPGFLLVLAVAWIACGVYALIALKASWKIVPGVFFIGLGVLFLRGAAVTVIRRSDR